MNRMSFTNNLINNTLILLIYLNGISHRAKEGLVMVFYGTRQIKPQPVVAWHFDNVTTHFVSIRWGFKLHYSEYRLCGSSIIWPMASAVLKVQSSASDKTRKGPGSHSKCVYSLCRLLTKVHTWRLFWSCYIV